VSSFGSPSLLVEAELTQINPQKSASVAETSPDSPIENGRFRLLEIG